MNAGGHPIIWNQPETWPWIVFLWIVFVAAGSAPSIWKWLKKKRAAAWPITDGRITAATIVPKSLFSLSSQRAPYRAELSYIFASAGGQYSGTYARPFYSEAEAAAFVQGLDGQPVAVHYDPAQPSQSMLLDPDVERLLQSRPFTESPASSLGEPFPAFSLPILKFFAALSCTGLILSLWVHIGALTGQRVAPFPFFIGLHLGIFVVWIPAVLAARRLAGTLNRPDIWKIVLRGCPDWLRYLVYGFFGYAIVNFLFFMTTAPFKGSGADTPATVWRGFSGHWMAFYSAAFAILWSAIHNHRSNQTAI